MLDEKLLLADEVILDIERHSKLIAHLTIFMFVVSVLYYLFSLFFKFETPWYIFASLGACSLIAFSLNRFKKYTAAKVFGLSTLNLIIYAVSSSESHLTNINLYYITCGVGALMLFEYKEWIKSFSFVLLSLTLYFLSKFLDYSPLATRHFTEEQTNVLSVVNLIVFAYVSAYLIILLMRSNHIKREYLLNQNKELIKINRELDQFIYSASHDLKAPLSSLKGLIQLSELEPEESARKSYLIMMKERIASMDSFIKEIIDYAKNVRQEVDYEKIVIKDLLANVMEELKYMEGARTVKIQCVGMDDLVIMCDTMRLKIIFANIISNAIKYRDTSKESPTLIITAILGAELRLEFKDNGLGISSGQHKKIFDMFYRAHETSSGSGLGLYLVKETLSNLKGTIQVESVEGGGSTFIISLPLSE